MVIAAHIEAIGEQNALPGQRRPAYAEKGEHGKGCDELKAELQA
jgi:hypothetical protein